MRKHMATGLLVILMLMAMLPATSWAAVIFAQLSDTHLMKQGPDGSWLMLKDAPAIFADMLAQLDGKAQFVIITGNVVHSPDEWDTLATLASQSTLPVYVCLGNRDVANGNKLTAIHRLNQLNSGSVTVLDRGYYSLSPVPGLRLLMLDTAGNSTGKGQLDAEQQAWIKQQLQLEAQSSTPATVVVAMHHPLIEPYASPSRRLPDVTRQTTLSLLEQSPLVSMVLSGAYHAAKIQRRNGILHISTPSLTEYPMAARLITIQDNGQVQLAWVTSRLQSLAQVSRSRSPWVGVANGVATQDHTWQGSLRYYPTPDAVVAVKQAIIRQQEKLAQHQKPDAKAVKGKKPAIAKKPLPVQKNGALVNMLPKPAPIMVHELP